MYLKLIFRGIIRHKKRGIKFFILLTVCFMMTIFSLSFQDSFYKEYVELGINARNAHLTIYPSNSVWLKNSFTSIQKDEMPLLEIDDDFERFVNDLPEVEIGTPIIETGGAFYTKEGNMQSGGTITGVRAEDFKAIFPGIELLEGDDDITVKADSAFIPLLRWNVRNNEIIKNIDIFKIEDFKVTGLLLEDFKEQIQNDFPDILTGNYSNENGNEKFLEDLNKLIETTDLHTSVPEVYVEKYDYSVVNTIGQIKEMTFESSSDIKNWNKKLIQAIYPEFVNEVPEGITLNKPMGLFIGSTEDTRPPILLPVEFVGYCEGIPEFYGYNFIDLNVLQNYIDLKKEDCTAYHIRLYDEKDMASVEKQINDYIKERGFDYKVVDYEYIGNKTHIPLAIGVRIVFRSLIVIFLLISIFFVSYIVTISIIRRRKEIGTNIVLGMENHENIIVLLGENLLLITISWVAASLLMSIGLSYLSQNGLGGIIFFPKGKLYFRYEWTYFIQAYLFMVIPGLLASLIPTLKLRKITLVELLKGELSPRQSRGKKLNVFGNSGSDSGLGLTLKLAFRNVFANKRRNLIIFIIFTLVITILYLFLAYGDGVVANFRNGFQALNDPRSDIIATHKDFVDVYEVNPMSEDLVSLPIVNHQKIYQGLKDMDFVESVYLKTVPITLDLFADDSRFKNLSFRGVDKSMFDYIKDKVDIVEGRMIDAEDTNVILLNEVNRDEIKVEVGDTVTALGSDLFNHVITEDFKVIGYYKPKIDTPFFTSIVFSDQKGYNNVSGYLDNEINYININIKDGKSVNASVETLNQWAQDQNLDVVFNEYGDVFVQDDEKYGAGRKMIRGLTYLVIVFVMIGITNMILINLYDRRKEIGTYYCVGAEKSLLMKVYTLELIMINLTATFVGVGIGYVLQRIINALEISSTNPGIQIAYGGSVFYLDFNPTSTLLLMISVILITFVISMLALRSSLKVSPIVALQETDE